MNDTVKLAAGVQFRRAGKIYTFVTGDASLKKDEAVMVESEGGTAIALIAVAPHDVAENELPTNAKKILHRASTEELAADRVLRERAMDCFRICQEKIRTYSLPMKLAEVEVVEGGKKAIFTFFSEQRVDFRNLVKDLAGALHMRIEMRQVGSRDEAKIAGCIGPCGLTTCCSTHLRQFQSISISMAKHQGLAPNPAKLTGMCGKLKCCLAYECAAYDECRAGLPKVGAAVEAPDGPGKVVGHNVLKRECTVRLYGGGETRVACDKCRVLNPEEREAAMTTARQVQESADERSRRRGQDRSGRKERRHDKAKR
ncbi:MAG: regulatory iron-sulfur-containing complex subunit RicT [bacterium]